MFEFLKPLSLFLLFANPARASNLEAFAALENTYIQVQEDLQTGQSADATRALSNCTVSTSLPARELVDSLEGLLSSFDDRVDTDNPSVNAVPLDDLARIADMLGHEEQRLTVLGDARDPASNIERAAGLAGARASLAVLSHLAAHPFGAFDTASAGLLQARAAVLAIERVFVAAGHDDLEAALAASWIHQGADAATALRYARTEVLRRQLRADPTNADLALLLNKSLAVLDWTVKSDHPQRRFRGASALAGADAVEVLMVHVATGGAGYPDLPSRKLAFLAGTLGTAPVCTAGSAQLGGSPGQAEEAIQRAFEWKRERGADGLHAIGGFLAQLPAPVQQEFLCHAALSNAPSSVVAALALSGWTFHVSHVRRLGKPPGPDDKDLSYAMALAAIIGAAELRRNGDVPVDAWWTREFGALLVPLLNPMYGGSSKPARYLQIWARTEATLWLHGQADDPDIRQFAAMPSPTHKSKSKP